ncbi:MAG: 50S ribosomal protein L34e [Aigarchaeota archaeon]|nr:50S ribosomal protein L34e [Aigarchaeota archaeon]MCX8193072.1 50S ribosomal protein L34e [Nitrososphaeria archaeon]MDW7986921.1 50S ribosomal protein L34e [Nitrososphaerota archaeon]
MRRSLRTRARKKKFVRTPGGRVVVHIVDEKRDFHHCSRCGTIIHGIAREKDYKLSHSERTVERYYGRVLCHNCLEQLIRDKVYLEWVKTETPT